MGNVWSACAENSHFFFLEICLAESINIQMNIQINIQMNCGVTVVVNFCFWLSRKFNAMSFEF